MNIVFLGDARPEKGYSLLPSVVAALAPEIDRGRVRFIFQSNYGFDNPPADRLAVKARGALLASKAVALRDGPLETDDYVRLVRSAGIVLMPYDAVRYFARSSGVLAEGLAAGVPVIVPAGSWMAEQIQAEDVALHDELLAGHMPRRALDPCDWRIGSREMICAVKVDTGETHVLVQLRVGDGAASGAYTALRITMLNAAGQPRSRDAVMCPRADGRVSALFEIADGTLRMEIALADPYGGVRPPVYDVKVWHLRAAVDDNVPIGAVGRAYTDPADLADATREVLANYPAYRRRSSVHVAKWTELHNPDRLVEIVLARRGAAASDDRTRPVVRAKRWA